MSKVIGKGDFAKLLAEDTGLSQKAASDTLNAVLTRIETEIVAGNTVNFTGFGKYEVVTRAAREGVNPGTGEKIHIPETKVPVFRAGSTLKSAVK